ncbi:MAG: MATE family efflux transporter [Sphaerochaetaceae bacterium]|nr:MATE family efflux transporter [Sphaerochaetaceae bacterium]
METVQQKEENRMGTMPVGTLLRKMSLPAMFSMLIQALYNIVDSVFVSRFSEKALTAVSLSFPMQNLMFSFAVGISIGICSVISRKLGEKKNNDALSAAQTGYTMLLICAALFTVIGLTTSKPFFKLYTSDPELINMGTQYLSICLCLSAGCFVACCCEKSLQATGDTFHPMLIQLSGAIFNIIFDPICIFGLLGVPRMGVAGAAVATVAGQILSMVVGIIFVRKNPYVPIKFSKPSLNGNSVRNILHVGVPSVILQGIGTIMTSLMNTILISFSILATTVFGVYFKLQSFVFMPVFGLNQGLMPILGFNYGAQNRKRMSKALRLGLTVALSIMIAGCALFQLIPDKLLDLFSASEEMKAIGCTALRRISLSFPLAAVCIILGAQFQAIGDGWISMVISIVRQIVFLVPAAWILGKTGGLDSVWFAFIFAEVFSLAMSLFFFRRETRRFNF